MAETTLSVHYVPRVGAVDRIISLLRRRGFPIDGMTLERTHLADVGRMTVVVQQAAAEQVRRHLSRLPDVLAVALVGAGQAVQREYALARIRCAPPQRPEVMALLAAFGARALSVSGDQVVIETAAAGAEIDALFGELERYGIEEAARTSPMALPRTSQENDKEVSA